MKWVKLANIFDNVKYNSEWEWNIIFKDCKYFSHYCVTLI